MKMGRATNVYQKISVGVMGYRDRNYHASRKLDSIMQTKLIADDWRR